MEKAQVLIVEDDGIIALDLESRMKKLGYGVTGVAGYGEQAIEKVKENTPDVVLMDIILKGEIDGIDAAKEIRTQYDIPVIFITGYADKKRLERAKLTYPFGFIIKPFQDRDLEVTIEMALYVAKVDVERKLAEEALRESEETMRYIIKHDPNAIAVYDRNLRYIAVSVRYLQDYNVKEADIIGRHHYEVFPEMPQRWKDVHQRCLAGAIERNDDDYFERPDGSITYNRWECRPWYATDGEIGGMITYTEVTTGRRLAEEALRKSEEKYRSLVANIPDVIWTTDFEGKTSYISPNIEKEYGYTPEEIYEGGTSIWLRRIHPEDAEKVEKAFKGLLEKGTMFDVEYRIKRKDGEWLWLHDRSMAVYEKDGVMYADDIFSNITARKQAEESLIKSETD